MQEYRLNAYLACCPSCDTLSSHHASCIITSTHVHSVDHAQTPDEQVQTAAIDDIMLASQYIPLLCRLASHAFAA